MKIIAELCQNHNGDFDTVRRMVDAAAEGGATHVKIQHIYVRNLVYRPQFEEGLEQNGVTQAIRRPWQTEHDRLKPLELSDDDCVRFVEYADSVGLEPITTCFARGDVDRIAQQGFREVKVASYDCASFQMLRELSARFEHLYVSTGATFDDELGYAAEILRSHAKNFSLLHCITRYPTPLDNTHLNRIGWLENFADEVGFSDHSLVSRDGIISSKAAIACGAQVVERHFTVKGVNETKDGPVSVSADYMRVLAEFAKMSFADQREEVAAEYPGWETMLGDAQRWLTHAELLNRDYYRGRLATPRREGAHCAAEMIFNWEETPV